VAVVPWGFFFFSFFFFSLLFHNIHFSFFLPSFSSIGDNREHCYVIPVAFKTLRQYLDAGFEVEEFVRILILIFFFFFC